MLVKPFRLITPTPFPIPDKPPTWCTVIGAWGDALASLGNIEYITGHFGMDKVNVLVYGFDSAIREFVMLQPYVDQVLHITPDGRDDYIHTVSLACMQDVPQAEWLDRIVEPNSLLNVCSTHVDFGSRSNVECHRFHGAILPGRVTRWAEQFLSDKPQVLINPFSLQSTNLQQHWPWWNEAIDWLTQNDDFEWIITGQHMEGLDNIHNAIDLRGKAPSMMHVFALANQCGHMISTSNGLCMWSVVQGISSVICCNSVLLNPNNYFTRWVNTEPNVMIHCTTQLNMFQLAMGEVLEIWKVK